MDGDVLMMTKASLAHQEEGESGEADPSGGHQRRLHGRVLSHPSGRAGERAEPLLREEKQEMVKNLPFTGKSECLSATPGYVSVETSCQLKKGGVRCVCVCVDVCGCVCVWVFGRGPGQTH
ncbi:hypothetical protein F7725_026051 [Dissostichus mawsoni]|uniref:Uncharacterized protein n=1 Tax=Dissostichus mawsoni TaxID=36200 RepID=A0A7J5X600_DISMA|nr:hypothetical protein F7725_026051 [Dissostichus mawsoni]